MEYPRELFLMQQTYASLFTLANKIQVKGDQVLGKLTSRQHMAMIAIAHLPEEETTLNNIARKLGTTKQSVKQLITIIEAKGYVTTLPSPKDKRAVNVIFTDIGKQILMEATEKGIAFLTELFKAFTMEDLETMWSLIKKMYPFDGEEQDGFEEDADLKTDLDQTHIQNRVITEFVKRRNESLE